MSGKTQTFGKWQTGTFHPLGGEKKVPVSKLRLKTTGSGGIDPHPLNLGLK